MEVRKKGIQNDSKISFHLGWVKMSFSEKRKRNKFQVGNNKVALDILGGIPLIPLIRR